MMKKLVSILLTVSMAGMLVLTGCGSSESKKTEDGKTLVRFMVGGSAAEPEQYQKAVDAFNEQSKDTNVELIGVPGDNYNEKVLTQLKSKEAPDCCKYHHTHVNALDMHTINGKCGYSGVNKRINYDLYVK